MIVFIYSCRHYLRYRDDTVRCVVTSLTEDGPSDLADELIRGDTLPDEDNHSDDDIDNWQGWQPDPVHADPSKIPNYDYYLIFIKFNLIIIFQLNHVNQKDLQIL